ncbi:MAG: flavodoxin domain-containing protein [Rhodoplanes sp.]
MKPILVAYSTTEGHTRKIAEFIADRLRLAGKSVDLVDCATPEVELMTPMYAGAFVGGSVHHQKHQLALQYFVKQNSAWLNVMPTAFFSVNLAMLHQSAEVRREAKHRCDAFLEDTGLAPCMTYLIAGAIKYSEYDFFKRALFYYFENPGGLKAAATADTEYTDWSDLGRFVDEYLAATQSDGR